MSELLTQRDIDTLLGGPEATPNKVTLSISAYDFVRPPRVSKDRLAILEVVHARLARSLESLFSSRLRAPADVTVTGIEQATLAEYQQSLAPPSAAFVFKLGGRATGLGALDIGADLAFHLVDRLFGGSGEASRQTRPLTSLEQLAVRGVADRMVALLGEAWQEQAALAPEIVAFESSAERLEIANREDSMLIASLELRSESFTAMVTFALPMAEVERWLEERRGQVALDRAPSGESLEGRALLAAALQHARIALSARLPAVWLSTRTVASLQVGEVIPTVLSIDTPLEVHVNGRFRFLGTLGQLRRRIGLRITQSVAASDSSNPVRIREGRVR